MENIVSPKMKNVYIQAEKVAITNATVMLTGESGVGKEVVANYIHNKSKFNKGLFVAVNCAAIPDNMLEAILFGYEKGSFTGAYNSQIGKFEQSQNGTIFLDEISEMSYNLQAKLLRVIQEKKVEKLGSKLSTDLNLRIIAASNADLKKMVKENRFREDLYYRLNVFPINIPPLRERKADIVPIAEFFIKKYSKEFNCYPAELTDKFKEKLILHNWEGNVRELENVMQKALILNSNKKNIDIDLDCFETNSGNIKDERNENCTLNSKLENQEYKFILDCLKECDGFREKAASKLNISSRTLRYKLAKMKEKGIKVPNYKELSEE